MKLIGLCGYKRSGKTTVAAFLRRLGYNEMAYATPIKLMLGTLFQYAGTNERLISDVIDGNAKETCLATLQNLSTRHAMQTLGTEWGRNLIGQDLWVDILFNRARVKRYGKVVISDVRFDNEVVALHKHGGKLIRIERGLASDGHASECINHIEPDYVIHNQGSLQLLEHSVRDLEATLWKQSS